MEQLSQDLKFISRNAAKLARKLSEFVGTPEMLAAMAANRIIDEALSIILEELERAINVRPMTGKVSEYSHPLLREKLIEVFSNPAILTITRDRIDIRTQAFLLGGNAGDLQQGIDAAREVLGLGRLDHARALEFWRERIYRPAREGLVRPRRFKKNVGVAGQKEAFDYAGYGIMKYETTIETRVSFWGEKAPYWIWLNYGSTGGYPEYRPTNFVEKAEKRISNLYTNAIIQLTNEFTNAITAEIQAFLLNPQTYEPGTELARFEMEGAEFMLGVTPTGELAVRRTG